MQQITIFESQIRISEIQFGSLCQPKVILDWKIEGREFRKVKEFCKLVKSFFALNGLGDLLIESWIENEANLTHKELLTHVSYT